MSRKIGRSWAEQSWITASWTTAVDEPWRSARTAIGASWRDAWEDGSWDLSAWFPSTSSAGGELPRVNFYMKAQTLSVATVAEGGAQTGWTLPAISFYMKPGSVLDLEKTLPVVSYTHTQPSLDAEVQGTSVVSSTLSSLVFDVSPANLIPQFEVPPISVTFSPQAYDRINVTLPMVKLLIRPRVSVDGLNLTSDPLGLKRKKLIKRGKGLFRKSAARAQEDLINEIVDGVDAEDYEKEQ